MIETEISSTDVGKKQQSSPIPFIHFLNMPGVQEAVDLPLWELLILLQ